MSELTRCNRCSLNLMIAEAAKRGAWVILGKDEYGWVTATYSDQENQDEPSAHFMQLTKECVC